MSLDKVTVLAIQLLIFVDYSVKFNVKCNEKTVRCGLCAASLGLWSYWALPFFPPCYLECFIGVFSCWCRGI